ncbi:MAG TPA: flagellar hook protein FlgE [Terracidiphilus sp.]|nr:flagellar hook protein FlgE [Terracidiphilus sp.]
MASFSIPLTGLEADSTALNTIANNLANMNTTAFKSQTADFANLFFQEIGASGSGDPMQVGAGVHVDATETDFTQGTLSATGNASDVALNGNGFFVAENNGTQLYTRDGDFTLASNGSLITQDGFSVMGYPAANGVVNTDSPIVPITIPVGSVLQPQATGNFGMTANLDASSATNTAFPAQITLYDSLGVAHSATVTYTKTANNTWSYSVALPAGDFSGAATTVSGSMSFDQNGNLTSITPQNGQQETVGTAPGDVSSIAVGFPGLSDGAANLQMKWNLLGANGQPTITQVSQTSAVSATTQDGYASGQYESFSIAGDGTVSASFSNGQQLAVGQLAVANVTNEQGLQALADGNYATTLASGNAILGQAGSAGLGTVQDGALEGSNVNISAEFSDLIVAQRAFEANSKSITTFDTITQETIEMIH